MYETDSGRSLAILQKRLRLKCEMVTELFRAVNRTTGKGGRALRGKFGPLWSQKLKVAFHQFHPIGLLEEWSKCKILAFILLFPLLW